MMTSIMRCMGKVGKIDPLLHACIMRHIFQYFGAEEDFFFIKKKKRIFN